MDFFDLKNGDSHLSEMESFLLTKVSVREDLNDIILLLPARSYVSARFRSASEQHLQGLSEGDPSLTRLLQLVRKKTSDVPYIAKADREAIAGHLKKLSDILKTTCSDMDGDEASEIDQLSAKLKNICICPSNPLIKLLDASGLELRDDVFEYLMGVPGVHNAEIDAKEGILTVTATADSMDAVKKAVSEARNMSDFAELAQLRAGSVAYVLVKDEDLVVSEGIDRCQHAGWQANTYPYKGLPGTAGLHICVDSEQYYTLTCAHVVSESNFSMSKEDDTAVKLFNDNNLGHFSRKMDYAAIPAGTADADDNEHLCNRVLCRETNIKYLPNKADLKNIVKLGKELKKKVVAMKVGKRSGITMGTFHDVDNVSPNYRDVLIIDWINDKVPFAMPGD